MHAHRRITTVSAVAATLAVAAGASAAQAPTLGAPAIIKAGQTSPIAVGGNHLASGATIREGTELRRWLVTMHGPSNRLMTLKCGPGGRHLGLGARDDATVTAVVESAYGKRTIKVRFRAAPGVDADGAKSNIYALCGTSR